MAPIPTEELESKLLSDPDCPWSKVMRDSYGRGMSVRTFRKFADQRGYDPDDVEAAMNEYVARRGGKRQRITDPWKALPNLVRKLGGQDAETDDVWRIPKDS